MCKDFLNRTKEDGRVEDTVLMTLRNVSKSHLQTGKHICMWDGFSPQANW